MNKRFITLTAVSFIGIGSLISYHQFFKEKQYLSIGVSQEDIIAASMNQSDIPLNKEWVITYDNGINQERISEKSIYVLDDENNEVPVKISVKG
ncbi:hypothetical protein GJU40_16530 [Bacillus lacus]|uniref:DUF3139 domain-containing protein n=1 Tax=Metabacillus lacus TaxID=1983721 RepID=A0A7X2J1T7_9BACI|nr:hypothetical protein [Metabacillus lacus]MRX73749.1 hypothetical protein [Metabacillus lacus]